MGGTPEEAADQAWELIQEMRIPGEMVDLTRNLDDWEFWTDEEVQNSMKGYERFRAIIDRDYEKFIAVLLMRIDQNLRLEVGPTASIGGLRIKVKPVAARLVKWLLFALSMTSLGFVISKYIPIG